MGDIYQPRIVVRKPIIICKEGQPWSIKISHNEQVEGRIKVAMHWNDKEEPTHEFNIDQEKFFEAVDQLRKPE